MEKPALKPIVGHKSQMSIRLCSETGLLKVTVYISSCAVDIDKNCGEIEKKYWTAVAFDFTLEADR